MKRIHEEDLVAYNLGELPWWKARLLRRRLQADAELAAASEEIAATLRAFSSAPVPEPSAAVLERSWQQVRTSLGVLDPVPHARTRMWVAVSASAVGVGVIAAAIAIPRMHTAHAPGTSTNHAAWPLNVSQRLETVLLRDKTVAEPYNKRPGPLTTAPVDAVTEDSALATHLDAAERVLTEISHTDGTLQPETREQVHRLLLENAVYRQSAEQHGYMETAAVIDDLGRVLTSLDAEPLNGEREEPRADRPDGLLLEMNLGGVLLDLRILHSSDSSRKDQ